MWAGDTRDFPAMHSAQIAATSTGGKTNSGLDEIYLVSIHERDYIDDVADYDESWLDADCTFSNLPDGYKVYVRENSSSTWTYYHTFDYGDSPYQLNCDLLNPDCLCSNNYQIKLTATNSSGDSYDPCIYWSLPVPANPSDIQENTRIIGDIEICIGPNPFHSTSSMKIMFPEPCSARLELFDINQKKVMDLANRDCNYGQSEFVVDANNLPSGTYYIRLIAQGKSGIIYVNTEQVTLIK